MKAADDWSKDPGAQEWISHVVNDMVPKLKDSVMSMSLVPGGDGDVKFWVELGASIMLDKPIIAVVFGDREVPRKLEQIADEIVRCPEGVDPEASQDLAAALERMVERYG